MFRSNPRASRSSFFSTIHQFFHITGNQLLYHIIIVLLYQGVDQKPEAGDQSQDRSEVDAEEAVAGGQGRGGLLANQNQSWERGEEDQGAEGAVEKPNTDRKLIAIVKSMALF